MYNRKSNYLRMNYRFEKNHTFQVLRILDSISLIIRIISVHCLTYYYFQTPSQSKNIIAKFLYFSTLIFNVCLKLLVSGTRCWLIGMSLDFEISRFYL